MNPKLLYQLTFEGSWPISVAFLDSSRQVAAGNQDGDLFVWELPETPPEFTPKTEGERKREAANVPPTRKLVGHTNGVSKLLYDAGRKQLLSSSYDRTLRVWSLAQAAGEVEAVLDRESREREFKRTKKQEVLDAPGIKLAKHEAAHVVAGHNDWIHTLAVNADFSRWLSGDAESQVICWDASTRQPVAKWKGHPWNWIIAAALTPDGLGAVVSEYRYKRDDFDIPAAAFKVWSAADGQEKLDILKVQFPKLNPQDATYGGGQLWRKFIHQGLVAVAYSPDGKLIAAAQGGETDTGKVHIVGKLLRTISGHQYGATDVLFSRDGERIFSAGRDTCVRVTNVADGKEIAVMGAPRGGQFKDWISAIAVSADESMLAAADIAGQVAIWQLK
jgi:WD40 repeat protein